MAFKGGPKLGFKGGGKAGGTGGKFDEEPCRVR